MEVIVKEAKAILELQRISARSLAQLIEKMSAALLAIQPAPLHYRSLQNLKHIALRKKGYNEQIGLCLSACKDLEWWIHNLSEWNGRTIQAPDPTLVIETDTLKKGWGTFCQGIMTGGCWNA